MKSKYFISYSSATVMPLLPCLVVHRTLYQRQRCTSGQNTLDFGLLIHSGFLSYEGIKVRAPKSKFTIAAPCSPILFDSRRVLYQ